MQTTALARREELPTRLGVALVGSALLWHACGPLYAGGWAAAVLVTQFASTWVNGRFCDLTDTRPPSTLEWVASVVVMLIGGVVYSAIAPMLWFGWGEAGKMFAMVWLCGALMHVALHMHHDRPQFVAGMASHLVFFAGLPIHSLVTGASPGRIGAAATLLAVVLYLSHCLVAFKRQSVASASLRAARERAQERQAAAEEANRIKGQFLAMMSHELRTPMNGVLGMARLLMNSELTSRQHEQVRALHDAGDMLMSILNDVLDFSKIEARKVELEDGEIDLHQLMSGLAELWRGRAEEKGLTLEAAIAPNTPRRIHGDPVRVRQILFNLISNAVKFTDKGGVGVTVQASEVGLGVARLRFEVRDTGCGVAPEDIDRLFVAFEQADRSTTRRFGGTGLGLSISRELSRLMGGDIRVESHVGVGSRFEFVAIFKVADSRPCPALDPRPTSARPPTVTVEAPFEAREEGGGERREERREDLGAPTELRELIVCDDNVEFEDVTGIEPSPVAEAVVAVEEEPEAVPLDEPRDAFAHRPSAPPPSDPAPAPAEEDVAFESAAAPAPVDGPRLRVCCAEDQEMNRRVISALLERLNCELTFAHDGREAIKTLRERRFDLVFMDLQMPYVDGIEATRRTRKEGGPNADTPIIGLTANVLSGVREDCLEAGMDDFVGKPIDVGELFKAIERVFAARALPAEASGAA